MNFGFLFMEIVEDQGVVLVVGVVVALVFFLLISIVCRPVQVFSCLHSAHV
jgi:ABC-type transport system involved in multi-copper enzyme maturation permease subunit